MSVPKSRSIAKDENSKWFDTGKPCKRGHYSKRFTSTGACVACHRENIGASRARVGKPLKLVRIYVPENKIPVLVSLAAYWAREDHVFDSHAVFSDQRMVRYARNAIENALRYVAKQITPEVADIPDIEKKIQAALVDTGVGKHTYLPMLPQELSHNKGKKMDPVRPCFPEGPPKVPFPPRPIPDPDEGEPAGPVGPILDDDELLRLLDAPLTRIPADEIPPFPGAQSVLPDPVPSAVPIAEERRARRRAQDEDPGWISNPREKVDSRILQVPVPQFLLPPTPAPPAAPAESPEDALSSLLGGL